ncbi:MAG: SpoIID/LytB domain-containing protein [bacterium]|nr:SpoIID/LytB domain-containing protein [bacterium]MDZ4248378.1 SpoIID/LytB domain-containing protein [Patescibacteria group bacterium]
MNTGITHKVILAAVVAAAGAVMVTALSQTASDPYVAKSPPAPQAGKEIRSLTKVSGHSLETVKLKDGKETKAAAGHLVVRLENDAAKRQFGDRLTGTSIPNIYLLSVDEPVSQARTKVAALPGVRSATPDFVVAATRTPDDPHYPYQWGLPKIKAPAAWDRTVGSSSVIIASIDTGVNASHQDLSGKMWTNPGETCGDNDDDDGNGYIDDCNGMDFVNGTKPGGVFKNDANGPDDDQGHGTLTSSVFAADTDNGLGVAGVDWNAKVLAIKVLDSDGYGLFSDVAEGIRYAGIVGADVANMSLGADGLTTETMTDTAINEAIADGVILAAASGNDGYTNSINYPAINPYVISVGATTSTDARAGYSNGGSQLDLVAPGSGIRGAYLGNTSYVSASGTSLSTPHVAGVAGLLRALDPDVSYSRVRTILKSTADTVSGMNGATRTNLYGEGRLDANGAQSLIKAYSSEWVRQSATATAASGTDRAVYVDYKNVGLNPWSNTGSNPVRLGTSHTKGHSSQFYNTSWLSKSRPASFTGRVEGDGSVTETDTIQPGETARFSFTMTSPPRTTTTTLREYFQPVVEGVTWLEDQSKYITTTVPGRYYRGQLVGKTNPPPVVLANQLSPVTADVKNTGTATWRNDTSYDMRLGTVNPVSHNSTWYDSGTWLTRNRLGTFVGKVSGGVLTPTNSIAPGETARWSFQVKAPSRGGTYHEYFSSLIDYFGWQKNLNLGWTQFVPSTAYDYKFVSKAPHYQYLARDETKTIYIRLRNMGYATWRSSGSGSVRLGTDRPQNRGSGFSDGGTAAGWITSNRIKLGSNLTDADKNVGGETSVAPGEIGEFEFDIVGKPRSGTYKEYFRPLVEGRGWMKDIGINWSITVENPIDVALTSQSSATMSGTNTVTIVDVNGTNRGTVAPATDFIMRKNGSRYQVLLPGPDIDSCCVLTAQQAPGNRFLVTNLADNGSQNYFRGEMSIRTGSAGTHLVNSPNLEHYLRGLGEVPDSWPIESIKAQITAARTFAARKIQSPRSNTFDIYDDTRDQVYNGYNSELAKPNHVTAVNATTGKVVKRDGSLIQAFYSSNAAGRTADNEDVWGGSPINYLRGKADSYSLVSYTSHLWPDTTSRATIKANYGFGCTVTGVGVVSKYPGDRMRTVRLAGSGCATRDYTLAADTHRSRLGLPSSQVTSITKSGTNFVFGGKGFGHGIGMSQYGAYNRAANGQSYVTILQFYYTGVTIGNL